MREHKSLSYFWFFLWALVRWNANKIVLPDTSIDWRTIDPENLLASRAEYLQLLEVVEEHLDQWHPPQRMSSDDEREDWNHEIERIRQLNLVVYEQLIQTRQDQVEIESIQKYLNVQKSQPDQVIRSILVRLNRLPLCTDYSCSGHIDPETGQLHRKEFCFIGFYRDAALWRYARKEVYTILRNLPRAVQTYFETIFDRPLPKMIYLENGLGHFGSLTFLGGLEKDEGYWYMVDFRGEEFSQHSSYFLLQSLWKAVWLYLNTILGEAPFPTELTDPAIFDEPFRPDAISLRPSKAERRRLGREIARSIAQTRST